MGINSSLYCTSLDCTGFVVFNIHVYMLTPALDKLKLKAMYTWLYISILDRVTISYHIIYYIRLF
jgi:hypothetical protein